MSTIVGYAIWRKTANGKPELSKVDKDIYDGKMAISPQNTKDEAESIIGSKIPLTAEQFRLSLIALEVMYACPIQPSSVNLPGLAKTSGEPSKRR